MLPVYYFETMPEKLPEDDACYIVSKYIYLKKRTGLIDAMVKVSHINMGEELPEFAKMKLPKIRAKVFGKVVGFFKLAYNKYHGESGVILNLKTHPKQPRLQKIDYTIPHQKVSSGRCKYNIVVDPSYINCGTIHCHSDFGAYHSSTDEKDERYFDGLHITVGHIDKDEVSISACVVINDKRVPVNPCEYIEGIKEIRETTFLQTRTKYYRLLDQSTIVSDEENLKFVTPVNALIQTTPYIRSPEWDKWLQTNNFSDDKDDKTPHTVCEECVFKEVKITNLLDEVVFEDDTDLDPVPFDDEPYDPYKHVSVDDMTFTEQDKTIFEKDSTPLFHSGEIDEDGIKRYDNSIRKYDFEAAKKEMIKKSIKCDGCGSTFFVENPEIPNSCPSCEKEYKGITYTIADYLKEKRSKEGASTKL